MRAIATIDANVAMLRRHHGVADGARQETQRPPPGAREKGRGVPCEREVSGRASSLESPTKGEPTPVGPVLGHQAQVEARTLGLEPCLIKANAVAALERLQ